MTDRLREKAVAVASEACGHPAWCAGFSSEMEDAIYAALLSARDEALEEAAQEADEYSGSPDIDDAWLIARAIRSLKSKT